MSSISNSAPTPPVGGATAGAAIGGAVGSFVPVLGTAAGAAIGGAVGTLVDMFASELSKRERERRYQEWQQRQEEIKRRMDAEEAARIEKQQREAEEFFRWFNSLSLEEQNRFLSEQRRRPGAERVGPEPIDARPPIAYQWQPSPSWSVPSPPPYSLPSVPVSPAFNFSLTEREGQLLIIALVVVFLISTNK